MGNPNESQGTFLSHQPCPKCGSRDNLAVYSDGHSYCFGCRYYTVAKRTTSILNNRSIQFPLLRTTKKFNNLIGLTTNLPIEANQWLKQYGLTQKEIEELDIQWSELEGMLIFPLTKNKELVGYIGRRFKGKGSKYIIKGEKKNFDKVYGNGSVLVFTEDLISAVKVGRVTAAQPVYGSFVNSIPDGYESYRIWLDKDKQISSIKQCRKWKQYGYDIKPIITELDPKEYNEQFIKERVW